MTQEVNDDQIQMKSYPINPAAYGEFAERFIYHKPTLEQAKRYTYLRMLFRELATEIMERTPPSREQELAILKLEEGMFWTNASIARNEEPQKDENLDTKDS